MTRGPLIIGVLAAGALGWYITGPDTNTGTGTEPEPAAARGARVGTVTGVVDGDTIRVRTATGTVTVRVLGIDTPETVHPDIGVECGGPAAARVAGRILRDRKVTLTTDATQGAEDRYGRDLAYVDLHRGGDFGVLMLRRGRAAEYTYRTPYHRQDDYRRLEAIAQRHDRGMWGSC